MTNLSSQVETPAQIFPPAAKPDQNIAHAAKGGSILFSGQLFAYGGRFLTGILLARFLAAEQFGLYNLTLVTVEIAAGLASCGLAAALVRYIPIYLKQQDKSRVWGTIQIGLGIPTILSIFLGVGLYVLAQPIAEQIFDEPKLASLLRLVSPVIVFYTLVDMIAAATRGFKNMHYTVIAQSVVLSVVKFILILSLALFGLTAGRAVTATTLTEVFVCCLLVFFLNKQFPLKRPLPPAKREVREILRFSLPNYLANLTTTFSGNIRTILLGSLHSIADVGIFAVARQINMISDMFHSSIVIASQPIVAELSSSPETRDQLKRYYQTMTRWSFTLNFPFFMMVVLFPDIIISIFGQSFAEGVVVLKILAWAGLINTGTGICGVLIDMSGNTHLKLINTITSVAATIGLSLLFIPKWGLSGAAVASLAAAVIINLLRLTEAFLLFRMLPYSLSFLKPVAAGLVALAASRGLSQPFPADANLIYLFLNIAVLLGVYIGAIVLLGLSQEDHLVIARLRQRLSLLLPKH